MKDGHHHVPDPVRAVRRSTWFESSSESELVAVTTEISRHVVTGGRRGLLQREVFR